MSVCVQEKDNSAAFIKNPATQQICFLIIRYSPKGQAQMKPWTDMIVTGGHCNPKTATETYVRALRYLLHNGTDAR